MHSVVPQDDDRLLLISRRMYEQSTWFRNILGKMRHSLAVGCMMAPITLMKKFLEWKAGIPFSRPLLKIVHVSSTLFVSDRRGWSVTRMIKVRRP